MVVRGIEDIFLYVEDILKVGKYKNDIEVVKVLIFELMDNIK